jgi:fermentation-respiration switch protein FrsA (DUF1100 family)
MRGKVLPGRQQRRHRSTRRHQDTPPLPLRGRRSPHDGQGLRPGRQDVPTLAVLTLTCPSYGRVTSEGTPVDTASYDYTAAARAALHFAARGPNPRLPRNARPPARPQPPATRTPRHFHASRRPPGHPRLLPGHQRRHARDRRQSLAWPRSTAPGAESSGTPSPSPS